MKPVFRMRLALRALWNLPKSRANTSEIASLPEKEEHIRLHPILITGTSPLRGSVPRPGNVVKAEIGTSMRVLEIVGLGN